MPKKNRKENLPDNPKELKNNKNTDQTKITRKNFKALAIPPPPFYKKKSSNHDKKSWLPIIATAI